jgi:hypothetical protein
VTPAPVWPTLDRSFHLDLFPFLVAVDAMFNLRGRIAMTPRGEIGGRRDRGAASGD